MSRTVLITGNSSGLGHGLTEVYLDKGWEVYGVSRRGCTDLTGKLKDIRCDLTDYEAVPLALETLLMGIGHLDVVILNAGILGKVQDMADSSLAYIQQVMEANVWSNKVLLDWLLKSGIRIDQIVLISSGASINGNRGWGAYALSKATLNMLTQLYAHEFPHTHLTALAPGLVDTAMQDVLCDPAQVDEDQFPSVAKLRAARETPAMPKPREAGLLIADAIPGLKQLPSGSFADIRTLDQH
ncbi:MULTISPECIES: SDR family NAD(P)-dependent oxidoreductase [Sedimenticola]|uniref:SDR family NAD(P)-dependent oxidoreductase n=1 Tax=Sedimenticola TaxID=349742 RepID=UPI00048EB39E|nr:MULTISPECIES: SDR family NAD(P)-dependent oxidoreductase [Sedimenticola]MCW8902354.1 SDR family NAD(P)-dependent oxidoreductase [Sedimenticola sp.]